MSRIKDEVTLKVIRGTPKNPDMAIAGLWLEYRMRDLAARYNLLADDAKPPYRGDYRDRQAKLIKLSVGDRDLDSPKQYIFTGKCGALNSEIIWKALIADVCAALDITEKFMDGAGITTDYSTKIRSPWFMWDDERGLLANMSKPMQLNHVGKVCRLGNGKEPWKSRVGDGGMELHDTQIKDMWALGEGTSGGKLASAARAAFKETSKTTRNDQIFEKLTRVMDRNSVLIAELIPQFKGDPEWTVISPHPWRIDVNHLKPQLDAYVAGYEKWANKPDPFQHELSTRNGLCTFALMDMLKDAGDTSGIVTENRIAKVMFNV